MNKSAKQLPTTLVTDYPQLKHLVHPTRNQPPIKVNGIAKISTQMLKTGFQLTINDKKFRLLYPKGIWQRFPKIHRKILAQNITYGLTFHLPYVFESLKKMTYNIPVPLSESFLYKGFSMSLPSTALMQEDEEKSSTSNLLRRLFDVDFVFSHKKTDIPPYNRTSLSDHVIMPFTFGKDSLLTFALTKELGIKIYPVYISEPDYPYEEIIKEQLAKPFRKEFRVKTSFLKNTLGQLREHTGWFGWELQLTHYSLMLLPYVYAKRAGFILFSNEQSCDDMVVDKDGFRYNPVYEQSHEWLLQNSLMASLVGGNSLSIGTLLEPIYEIAIEKILHSRYPEIAKYQSSCDLEQIPKNGGRWCENCSKCGRIYIFLLAIGVDPKTVGYRHNLLSRKYLHLYTIFSANRIKEYGFDQSEAGKDEQVFAFYLAYKLNHKGPIMDEFVKKYLKYAQKNERAFRKHYFGIHSSRTIPSIYKPKVLRIFKQELASLS